MVLTEKGLRTRDRILDATAALVVERGVANTCLDDVMAATKTSKSQLFHYFPDGKAELLAAVEVREAARIIDDQRPAIEQLGTWTAWEDWFALVRSLYAEKIDGCPVAALSGQVEHADTTEPTPGVRLYEAWLGALRDGIVAMQAHGHIRGDADAERLAMATLATVQGGAGMMQTARSIVPLDAALEAAFSHLRSFATARRARPTG